MPRILRGEADEAETRGFQSTVVSPHRSLQTERELVSNTEDVYHRHLHRRSETRCMGDAQQVVQDAEGVACITSYRLWNVVDATSDWPRDQHNQPDVNYPTRNATISVAI